MPKQLVAIELFIPTRSKRTRSAVVNKKWYCIAFYTLLLNSTHCTVQFNIRRVDYKDIHKDHPEQGPRTI
jgi:hypothetical protein